MSDLKRAAKALEDFTGHKPREVRTTRLDDRPVSGYLLGSTVGVAYEAKRDGKTEQYFHRFKKAARPDLVSKADGSQLYFAGGDYEVTERGIEDMTGLAYVVNPSSRRGRRAAASRGRKKRNTTIVVRSNPVRRRKRRRTTYRANPVARRRYRRKSHRTFQKRVWSMRRNPTSNRGGSFNIMSLLTLGAAVGVGAVGSEYIMGLLPLPENMKTGMARHATKAGVGIGAGFLVGKVLKQRKLGAALALGAITIAVHDALKDYITGNMPGVRLGQYISGGMGQYINGADDYDRLSYYTAGQGVNFAGSETSTPAFNP